MVFEKTNSGSLRRWFPFSFLYLGVGLIFLVLLLHNHFQLITAYTPLDYFESSMPAVTRVIAQGQNPYKFESQPSNMDVYPPLFNLIVAPTTRIFGNTLKVHRFVAGIFIIASCLVCFSATLKGSKSPLNSMAAAVTLYAALLFYSTPVASPNSTGLFFFMLSIIVPWMYNFTGKSLAIGLICGLLAFYSKQYFVLGLPFLCLYLLIAISIKKALIFSFCTVVCGIASLTIVHVTSPYYLDNTIFAVRDVAGQILSYNVMIKQLIFFCKTYSSLLVLLLFTGGHAFWRKYRKANSGKLANRKFTLNIKVLDKPLVSRKPDYFWFCFICSTLVIILILGRNPGNYMTYLFQLMSPFLLIAGFTSIEKSACHKVLLYPFIFYCFFQTYAILHKDFSISSAHRANWDKLVVMINANDHIYTSPVLLMPIVAARKKVYTNGQAGYLSFAKNKPDFFVKAIEEERVTFIWEKYIRDLYNHIETQKLDLIILDRWTKIPDPPESMNITTNGKTHLRKFYERRETIPISLVDRPGGGKNAMHIWRPKNLSKP